MVSWDWLSKHRKAMVYHNLRKEEHEIMKRTRLGVWEPKELARQFKYKEKLFQHKMMIVRLKILLSTKEYTHIYIKRNSLMQINTYIV